MHHYRCWYLSLFMWNCFESRILAHIILCDGSWVECHSDEWTTWNNSLDVFKVALNGQRFVGTWSTPSFPRLFPQSWKCVCNMYVYKTFKVNERMKGKYVLTHLRACVPNGPSHFDLPLLTHPKPPYSCMYCVCVCARAHQLSEVQTTLKQGPSDQMLSIRGLCPVLFFFVSEGFQSSRACWVWCLRPSLH